MIKKILLLSFALLILGCSVKKDKCGIKETSDFAQLFTKDEIYDKSLKNTHKAQLMASFETKALLTATYLNPVFAQRNCKKRFKNKMKDGEYFFIGVFITNSEQSKFNTKGYTLTLNGNLPIDIKLLDDNDPLRYEMPMMNNWSTYYKVKFPTVNSKNLTLVFENNRFGKDILTYEKEDDDKSLFKPLNK
ncbi:hypothetical protein MNB_SV-14-1592 [hydrothermal vent metagenome]|uniref:Lipoprotein n=1 Tax=hydrothermal vent metagenome TaxID=652676 RepID=A0A1W1CNT0_9ZZZZ